MSAAYTGGVWYNSGGIRDGWRYLDNLDLTAELDLERAAGWEGATAYVIYNNGNSLTELTGDAQVVSNIEMGIKALRLYEAWIEQEIGEESSVKIGLYDLNSEFDALETSAFFINSAHGIGTDIAQSGEAGPSIFPVTSLGLRLQSSISDEVTLRFAVLDGVPGDPARPARTAILLRDADGALLIGEGDLRLGAVRLLAGAWGYTGEQEQLDQTGQATSRGAYLRGEAVLADLAEAQLAGFFRAGLASGSVNPFSSFFSGGAVLSFPDDWQAGAAIAHARSSGPARRLGVEESETAIEFSVAKQFGSRLSLQPNVQLILDPAGSPSAADAVAFGLRATISL